MFKTSDLYACELDFPLIVDGKPRQGLVRTRYEVRAVTDVRNFGSSRSYRVKCSQRLVFVNTTPVPVGANNAITFGPYPIMASSSSVLYVKNWVVELLDYSPKTLNTTVQTSANESTGKSTTNTQIHTAGSSTSQTNSYSCCVGTGGVSADASTSTTAVNEYSNTAGTDNGTTSGLESNQSMSIKDWSTFVQLDSEQVSPTWVWAQDYPWNFLQYRQTTAGEPHAVVMPDWLQERLYLNFERSGQNFMLTLPPSELSQFGVDFHMQASWQLALPEAIADQTITLEHKVNCVTASHGWHDKWGGLAQVQAPMPFSWNSPALDLTLLGLDPIQRNDDTSVVGFVANKFICPPASSAPFKIISGANNLHVTGQGFDEGMTTSFSSEVKLTVQFKIIDEVSNYVLNLKHWKTTDAGCMLTIVVNGDQANQLVLHVDNRLAEGGNKNVQTLGLRDLDFESIDFHDYLVIGLNTLEIRVTPNSGEAVAGYALRALAIEQA